VEDNLSKGRKRNRIAHSCRHVQGGGRGGASPRARTVQEFISSQFVDAIICYSVCRAAPVMHGFRFTTEIMNVDKMTVFFKEKGKSL